MEWSPHRVGPEEYRGREAPTMDGPNWARLLWSATVGFEDFHISEPCTFGGSGGAGHNSLQWMGTLNRPMEELLTPLQLWLGGCGALRASLTGDRGS